MRNTRFLQRRIDLGTGDLNKEEQRMLNQMLQKCDDRQMLASPELQQRVILKQQQAPTCGGRIIAASRGRSESQPTVDSSIYTLTIASDAGKSGEIYDYAQIAIKMANIASLLVCEAILSPFERFSRPKVQTQRN
jgi:hypothetical protein